MVAIKHAKDVNEIMSDKDLRSISKNAANIFLQVKEIHDKKCKRRK